MWVRPKYFTFFFFVVQEGEYVSKFMNSHFSSDLPLTRSTKPVLLKFLVLYFRAEVLITLCACLYTAVELKSLRVAAFRLEDKAKPKSSFKLDKAYKFHSRDLWNQTQLCGINEEQHTSTGCFQAISWRVRGLFLVGLKHWHWISARHVKHTSEKAYYKKLIS